MALKEKLKFKNYSDQKISEKLSEISLTKKTLNKTNEK